MIGKRRLGEANINIPQVNRSKKHKAGEASSPEKPGNGWAEFLNRDYLCGL